MFRKVLALAAVAMLAGCSSHHQGGPTIQPPKAQPSKQAPKHLTSKQMALNAWKAADSGTLTTHTPSLADYTP